MASYDTIIIGAGAAGLLLADALGRDPYFANQRILLLEKEQVKGNDRTWCFWEAGAGDFDELLHARWDSLKFRWQEGEQRSAIQPYSYKMLRSADFYREYLRRIASYPNIELVREPVTDIEEEAKVITVTTPVSTYHAHRAFSSIFSPEKLQGRANYPMLLQHFTGWFVRTGQDVFDPQAATFMDFSISQKGNTRFMYVLPFSPREALVEYTLFSADLLPDTEYEEALEDYMRSSLRCTDYKILEVEKGRIPMSGYDLGTHNTSRLLHIGTAGGWTKPSTGFTFRNTARQVKKLVKHLKNGRTLDTFGKTNRFRWYDLLLLDALYHENHRGAAIFKSLFSKVNTPLVLKFLDEETSFREDLKVIAACPRKDFIKALQRRLF